MKHDSQHHLQSPPSSLCLTPRGPHNPGRKETGSCKRGSANPFAQRRWWHPTPVLLPGKSRGQRSPVGCSPWGRSESDRTELLHFHFSPSCIGEGHGNPLQYSCLENPRDRGAWWAAVYGVAQSWTRLKLLSSSSSSSKPFCYSGSFPPWEISELGCSGAKRQCRSQWSLGSFPNDRALGMHSTGLFHTWKKNYLWHERTGCDMTVSPLG